MNRKVISVFEHSVIRVGDEFNSKDDKKIIFEAKHFQALEKFRGSKDFHYYNLIYNGIKLTEYVGVIQVGSLVIEVLPKIDKYESDSNIWRDLLIGMLKSVGAFNVKAPSSSSLSLKSNYILDLYFELFIKEVEYLAHQGLVKKYRKTEGNSLSLIGNIKFGKHIQQNLVHQERFYIEQTVYDKDHLLHQIIFQAILLLKKINTNPILSSRISNLLINLPEVKNIKISESTFEKINLYRKTQDYKQAIEIAKLLLLNYHPDLSNGQNNILALMFDMNLLWEQFVYVALKRKLDSYNVSAQVSKGFWQSKGNYCVGMKPDIVIENSTKEKFVLDTKWKNITGTKPSSDDLRQMYVYNEYFDAKKTALAYPGVVHNNFSGFYEKNSRNETRDMECSVITISKKPSISEWQDEIFRNINEWIN